MLVFNTPFFRDEQKESYGMIPKDTPILFSISVAEPAPSVAATFRVEPEPIFFVSRSWEPEPPSKGGSGYTFQVNIKEKPFKSSKWQILVYGTGAVWSRLFCLEPEATQSGRSRSRLRDLGFPEPLKKVPAPQHWTKVFTKYEMFFGGILFWKGKLHY